MNFISYAVICVVLGATTPVLAECSKKEAQSALKAWAEENFKPIDEFKLSSHPPWFFTMAIESEKDGIEHIAGSASLDPKKCKQLSYINYSRVSVVGLKLTPW